jgi:hypothetical protein
MKKFLFTLIAAATLFSSEARAAALDLSALAGQYKATYTLQLQGSPTTVLSGPVKVTITVPKSGARAAIQIAGFGSINTSPGANYALLGNLLLRKNRVLTADNVLLAFYVQSPASTSFAGTLRHGGFSLSNNSGILGPSSIAYRFSFSGKKLSITGNGNLGTSSLSISLLGTKQGR